ncbi:BQ2448_4645 [Microbotryum intermedium]|uniref:BQ2448_4645 protein n=1 Tax=Microbotryum intermedium TaxID=269621 RepID=A0A238FIH7_9BASI|nr:BQ2448_4645 [Microbotryum intermedium]
MATDVDKLHQVELRLDRLETGSGKCLVPKTTLDEALPLQGALIASGSEGERSSFLSMSFDYYYYYSIGAKRGGMRFPGTSKIHQLVDRAGECSSGPSPSAGHAEAGDSQKAGIDHVITYTRLEEREQASLGKLCVIRSTTRRAQSATKLRLVGIFYCGRPSAIRSLMSPTADSASRRSVFPLRNPPHPKHKKGVRAPVLSSESEFSLPGPSSEQNESSGSATDSAATSSLPSPRCSSSPSPPASVASSSRSSTHASLPLRPPSKNPSPTSSTSTPCLRSNTSVPSFRAFQGSTPAPYQSSPYLSTPAGQAGPQSILATPVGHKPKVGISRLFAAATSKKQSKAAPLGHGSCTAILDLALASAQTYHRPSVTALPSTRPTSNFSTTSSTVGFGPTGPYSSSIPTFETAQDSDEHESRRTVASKRADDGAALRLQGLGIGDQFET